MVRELGDVATPVRDAMLAEEAEWLLTMEYSGPPGPLPVDPLGPDEWRNGPVGDEPLDDDHGAPLHPTADALAGAAPSAELATLLERTDPRHLDEYELVEMIAAYHRLSSWTMSRVTSLAGQLSRRPALNPHSPLPGGPQTLNVAADELAPRLGISRFAARRTVQAADLFRHTLEDTDSALREGRIDYAKALVLVRMLHDQAPDVAWEVQQQVLPDASHQTVTQLERAVSKAIIAVDPHRAAARHRKAREERRVGHARVLPDGMASIFAVLPATDAAGLDLALEAAARRARAAGDARTLEQLRADALALLGHGALERGYIGCPDAAPEDGRPVAHEAPAHRPAAEVVDDVPDDARPVAREAPTGPPAAEAAEDAPDHGEASPGRRHMPIGTVGGRRAQIQVTVPLSVLLPPEALSDGGPGPDDWMVRLQGDSSAHSHSPACPGSRRPDDVVHEHVHDEPAGCYHASSRVNAEAEGLDDESATADGGEDYDDESASVAGELEGCDDGSASVHGEPEGLDDWPDGMDDDLPEDWYPGPVPAEVAELHGYGPITPDVARALAYAGGTWQRLVTDPLSGVLLDVGRTRYRPPAAIADFVRLRDGTCVRPGCSTPAQRCEVDHITAWCEGGTTSSGTLACLCKGDHVVKTSGAFEIHHEGDGSFVWITPSGHRYRRDHTGRIALLPPASAVETVQRELANRFGEEPPF